MAGAGNRLTARLVRHSQRKRGVTDRPSLRSKWRQSSTLPYGEGLETDRASSVPRQSFTRQLFFQALQQNLTVKTFVGTSENALRIQIWTASIALLLLKWLHPLSRANWSWSNLACRLRLHLFTYRDLVQWLHHPMETPPIVPGAEQLRLALP